uniref:Uncharacterized protein n=1 Tax=Oryza sativa subsp. japonica TaxID=39947 RepID=Q7XIB1_ORYSJ|nr:hypothetical protein [Oryza sativa Japonica Group]BAD30476.1 hypothetical protein [Oryza sativa Japonica Group]
MDEKLHFKKLKNGEWGGITCLLARDSSPGLHVRRWKLVGVQDDDSTRVIWRRGRGMGAAGVGEEGIPRAYLMEVLGRRLGETGWSTASAKGTCNRDAAGWRRPAAGEQRRRRVAIRSR